MVVDGMTCQRLLLFYCSFTCVYFPGILILLKYNENWRSVGTYKFIPILVILMFAEVVKLLFSFLQSQRYALSNVNAESAARPGKSWSKSLKRCSKFLVTVPALFVSYYIIIVLFGAPLSTHREETTMLAVTLTTFTFIPAALHLGTDASLAILTRARAQRQGASLVDEALRLNIETTLIGTWLGAIAIPLDWDRPWQAWPIPCIFGALLGYTLGHFVTVIKIFFIPKLRRKVQR